MPSLIVWGERDRIIPAMHGERAREEMPGSRFELFENAGPLPPPRPAGRVLPDARGFVNETEPAELDAEAVRQMLAERAILAA